MILKSKKVILGLVGFGLASGLATMTALLLKNGKSKNKSAQQEVITKKNINTTTLQATSFLVANKTIKLKANVTIPNEIEIKYFKGDQAPRDSEYGLAPTDLKANDFVFIKFFIKSQYQQTHQFPSGFSDFIKLKISANESFKAAIATRNLVPGSFAFSGSTSGVTIRPKIRANIPPQVIVKYFKGSEQPNSDNAYKITEYLGTADNGDKVYIKFFIKPAYLANHFFPNSFTNPVQLTISGLKQLVATRNLSAMNASSFTISGKEGAGTITLKLGVAVPNEVEMRYFKGLSAPRSDSAYTPYVPTSLNNNDKVYVKFFIKPASQSTHQLPRDFSNNPIVITVSGLSVGKIRLDTSWFKASNFEFYGTNGWGRMRLKSGFNVPPQIDIRAISINNQPLESVSGLRNDEAVVVHFSIKLKYRSSHIFDNGRVSKILNLQTGGLDPSIDLSKLSARSFRSRRVRINGKLFSETTLRPGTIFPEGVEVRYKRGTRNNNLNGFGATIPYPLKLGESLNVAFVINLGTSKEDLFFINYIVFPMSSV